MTAYKDMKRTITISTIQSELLTLYIEADFQERFSEAKQYFGYEDYYGKLDSIRGLDSRARLLKKVSFLDLPILDEYYKWRITAKQLTKELDIRLQKEHREHLKYMKALKEGQK